MIRTTTAGTDLVVNPDLWLFLELEERVRGSGIFWDPRRGCEALRNRTVDEGNLTIVEIRTDHLLKYLQARQLSLVVGHYRHLHLFNPPDSAITAFTNGDVTLGSGEKGAKAIMQNWGLRSDIHGRDPFLQRRLHLWFRLNPPAIDVEDPWSDQPSFDPYQFVLPTASGLVAPARWAHFRPIEGRTFDGNVCDFMDRTYFRQEVLGNYEGAAGFTVEDDGSVSCHDFWALNRSMARLGNDFLSTDIGDFAESVPFEECPHWRQYSVEPPSSETAAALTEEPTVPAAVNGLVDALVDLNGSFATLAHALGASISEPPWLGSLDSLAGRQLKWTYSPAVDDDEFLKRATLASTFVLDALDPKQLRTLLSTVGKGLHQDTGSNPPGTLGSRNLLQRVALIAALIDQFQPAIPTIATLVANAEGKPKSSDVVVQAEIEGLYQRLRESFAPLAFLYDLRTHGGLAHPPNKKEAAAAALKLGLPGGNWRRADYLRLLNLAAGSIHAINVLFRRAANVIVS